MKIVILDRKTLGQEISLLPITNMGESVIYDLTAPYEVKERISDCDVIVLNKVKLNEDNLKYAKNLKLICVTATGFDNIDISYCKNNNIAVCNVKGYSTNSVSQVTVATVLSLYTKLNSYRDSVVSGEYTKSGVQNMLEPVYYEISGKTWGLFGYGDIGKRVGEIAKALGCRVIYTKNNPDENSCDFDTLLRQSDILTIHTPLTDKTRGIIDKKVIEKMKDGVLIVNEARGAVTNEEDIKDAVLSGKIGAFGCDVYSVEPMQENHPFQKIKNLPNVCLTPHMAWGAVEARQRCIDEISQNIQAFIDGGSKNRIV